jgi:hypothetical protein
MLRIGQKRHVWSSCTGMKLILSDGTAGFDGPAHKIVQLHPEFTGRLSPTTRIRPVLPSTRRGPLHRGFERVGQCDTFRVVSVTLGMPYPSWSKDLWDKL